MCIVVQHQKEAIQELVYMNLQIFQKIFQLRYDIS